ncbi:hypothetical protein BC827DRAFT_1266148 [Russula dissimulans]|nr:hypothetical protein BC827DRAFT_1266148 [Russula dissimulans]
MAIAGYSFAPSNNYTTSLPLADGTLFTIINTYSESQSKAVIALVVVSCVSLVATIGLLCAIAISAFNTRTVKDPNMFVRSHLAFYFVSLLLSDILQSIGSIMNSAWVREKAVVYGSLCTAQGIIKHTADVGIAVWSLVIATRTFYVLVLRFDDKHYMTWLVLVAQWSFVGALVIAGPATARTDKHGPFYGISGEWCWIAPNYVTQRIVLDYMVIFMSALLASILYSFVFLRLRGIVRARAPSTSIASAKEELHEKYEHRLARQMLLYPIAYTIMIIPITCCRFLAWSGHNVPFAATVFSDFVYLLSGLVHVILFACTRRILPPCSILPKFLISRPKVLLTSTAVASNDFDSYYERSVSNYSMSTDDEKNLKKGHPNGRAPAPPPGIIETDNPFWDPVLPPIDEAIVKRVHSPDSEYSSAPPSPHHKPRPLTPVAADYVDRSVLPEPSSPQDPLPWPAQDEARLAQGPVMPVPTPLKHREHEEIEVPTSPDSVLQYYHSSH